MDQLLPLASLGEAWGSRGGALGARVPKERLSALLPYRNACQDRSGKALFTAQATLAWTRSRRAQSKSK